MSQANPTRYRLTGRAWIEPLALLAACILCFGPLIPWLGFYWDDWPGAWFIHLLGPGSFERVFASDRPLLGRLFMLTTPLLGTSVLGWQIFGLLTRWAACLAFWWTLRQVWPRQPQPVFIAALLFAIYPGFLQQPLALTYSHAWIILAVFILSFGLMVCALRSRRWFWPLYLLSWLLSALVMFTDEYFFGLEFLRPIFIWMVYSEVSAAGLPQETSHISWRKRALKTIQYWLPYALTIAAFLVWRLVIKSTPRGQVTIVAQVQQSPLTTALKLGQTIVEDMFEGGLLAWAQMVAPKALKGLTQRMVPVYIAIALGAAAVAGLFLFLYYRKPALPQQAESKGFGSRLYSLQAIGIGLFGLFMSGWPFWATGLPIKLRFPWDRFTLAMMVPACLLGMGLLELLVRPRLVKLLLLSIIVGLAAGFSFVNTLGYRQEWKGQKDFFWQLAWRAPSLAANTSVITARLPFKYYTDNSLTAPLNWLYAPNLQGEQMPYLMLDTDVRLQTNDLRLKAGAEITQTYRTMNFSGSVDQAIVLYDDPRGCLRVLDPVLDADAPQLPPQVVLALPFSNLDLIAAQPQATPPVEILGPEPAHGWCYLYQKAALAQQLGDWQTIVRLAKQAEQQKYHAYCPVEMLPFIEGYARTGQLEKAASLTEEAVKEKPRLKNGLCVIWSRIPQAAAAGQPINPLSMQKKLRCPVETDR